MDWKGEEKYCYVIVINIITIYILLASSCRLHTDIQKNIFVALMGSENPEHAVQRILEVGHRKNQVMLSLPFTPHAPFYRISCLAPALQVPHVVAVILHTSLRQRVFNPFFSQVLCDISLCVIMIDEYKNIWNCTSFYEDLTPDLQTSVRSR